MGLIDLEREALRVCFAAQAPESALVALGDRRGWLLYREVVRERLRGELAVALPRTRLAAGDAAFERAFAQCLDRDPPRSRFFHEVVGEFVASALPALRTEPSLRPWVADLAEYEATLWEVADLDGTIDTAKVALAFDRPPLLSPTLRLLMLAHAVHGSAQADGTYAASATRLAVFRPADNERPRTWTTNASTHALLRWWQADSTLTVRDGVQRLGRERGIAVDATFVDGLCDVLARFVEHGLLLGSR